MNNKCKVAALVLLVAVVDTGIRPEQAAARSFESFDPCEVTATFTPAAHEYMGAGADEYPAQVFTAEVGVSHLLVTLELESCKENGLVDGQLEIVPAPGGVPDWYSPLGTAVVPSSQIPEMENCVPGTFGDVVFEFPSVELSAGAQYALVLQAVNGPGGGGIVWRRSAMPEDPPNPYAGGNLWTNDGDNPMEYANLDLQFDVCGTGGVSGLGESPTATRSVLLAAIPNPINPSTTVWFRVAAPGHLRLEVYDIAGREVRILVDEMRTAGEYGIAWNGRDDAGHPVPSGVYLARIATAEGTSAARVVVAR